MQTSMIQRHSSRTTSLSEFLPDVLYGATGYDRIAGYFRSSILEIAGEALENMAEGAVARIVCNSDLHPFDITTARAAQQAMLQEWKASLPADITPHLQERLQRLYRLLESGRLEVRVLPIDRFGLLHGKAGLIRHEDGSRLCFVGSANETVSAWKHNYEIVWADRSEEGCDWVQNEFEALWTHADAHPLAEAVIADIQRVAYRTVVSDLGEWQATPPAEASGQAVIEAPIYTRENGLWAHQKWFIHHAFTLHRHHGARLMLADQVGLGKTIQLALAAKLMLLSGDGNVLAVVPKALMQQWRDELWDMLALPSAIWTGKAWEDENGITHPPSRSGYDGLRDCPRRFGIVSAGLVKHSSDVRKTLSDMNWECVIVDEAHHARRRNTGWSKKDEAAVPNNMLTFLRQVAGSTRSMLLATATPVQMDLIEAFDLLDALNLGNWRVLGKSAFSNWRLNAREGLDIVSGSQPAPVADSEIWQWMRAPFPDDVAVETGDETKTARLKSSIRRLRERLGTPSFVADYPPEELNRLSSRPADRRFFRDVSEPYFEDLNPYITHIVRRRREFLEEAINPATNEPYLPKVAVRLFGDRKNDAIHAPIELREAFEAADRFCQEVGKRPKMSAGFLRTLLLRRVGSSVYAGMQTAHKMLGSMSEEELLEADEDFVIDDVDDDVTESTSKLHPLTAAETEHLNTFLEQLNRVTVDPKYGAVLDLLRHGALENGVRTKPWLELGCIIFSQYFDTADWIARQLTKEFPDESVAVYAGAGRSGIYRNGQFESKQRDVIKQQVREGEIRLLIGTDAASEGLNLQRLGTLINLDLPWNPTRLEQRKGRIQRIGQVRDEVYIANLRYLDSVEDKVHKKLSDRLARINGIFGQLPDTLEDVWIDIARHEDERAEQLIESFKDEHPFNEKYDRIADVDWESCSVVLDAQTQLNALMRGWDGRPR